MDPEARKKVLDGMIKFLTDKGFGDKPFNVSAYIKVKPECVEEVLKICAQEVADTQKDPGCIHYELNQSLADPTLILAYETWTNAYTFLDHVVNEHHQAFAKIMDRCAEGHPTYHFCVPSSEALKAFQEKKETEGETKVTENETKVSS